MILGEVTWNKPEWWNKIRFNINIWEKMRENSTEGGRGGVARKEKGGRGEGGLER